MAKFECDWCGKCCTSFGEYITIERQLSEQDYFCRYGITNELFPVHVVSEFADEIDTEYEASLDDKPKEPRKRCIFSRRNPDGKGFACAVYDSRPTICRTFRCYRMLILHVSGEIRGRVIGFNELRTHDEDLLKIWAEKVARLPHPIAAIHNAIHHPQGSAHDVHGHDTGIMAVLDGHNPDDREWVENVIAVLEAHGYKGDPVEP
jgi:Fe-S-cluster containining protein